MNGMEGRVIDPVTGRRLRRGGPKYRKLLRQNYIPSGPLGLHMVLEPSSCLRFAALPQINPVTKRSIAESGKVARAMRRLCSKDGFFCPMWQQNTRINPTTNRRIKRGGPSFRKLLRTCGNQNLCQSWTNIGKKSQMNPLTGRHTSPKTARKLDKKCQQMQPWTQVEAKSGRASTRCGNTKRAKTIGYALRVGKSTIPGAGRGLFAVEGFRKGDTITEYDGEVIDIETAERRRRMGLASHIRSLASGRLAIDGRMVPATFGHGGGSFANDPRDSKLTNAKFCNTDTPMIGALARPGRLALERSWLRATKDILPGQEILASYGKGYWK